MKRKSTLNFITSVLLKAFTIIFGIIIPKLFISSYGSNVNGLQSSVTQIFTYIALLEGGIGAATLQCLFGPIKKGNKDKVNSYISATSYYYNKIGFIYFGILLIISLGYAAFVKVEGMTFSFIFLYIIISGALTGINFFFQAKLCLIISADGKEYILSSIQLATFVITSIIKIALIPYVNIVILQSSYLLIHLFATLVYYLIYKKKYGWVNFKAKPDFSCLEQKNSVLIHKISGIIFQNVDILLLTIFFRDSLWIVSVYSIYKMVVNMVTSIVATFGSSVNFVLGQTFNDDSEPTKTKYKTIINLFDVYYSAISFALYTVMFILIIPFLKLYTNGLDFNYVYELLPYFYITIEFLTVGREAMVRTIEVAGHFKKTQYRALAETIINISVSIILILIFKYFYGPIGGIYGALCGTIFALLYRTIDIIFYTNKKILDRKPFKQFHIMGINLIVFSIIFVTFKFIPLKTNSYFYLFCNAAWITIACLIVYLIVQSIFNRKEFSILIDEIRSFLKRKKQLK